MIYNIARPVNFDQMKGQTMVVENIRNQSIKNQFFPVFILCGQYGSGKTTMSRIIAMAANCHHKDEKGNPCGKCSSCKAVLSRSSEGIIEVDGASNSGVENVRKLIGQAFTIGLYDKKVIVIDEAHKLSNSAFNALLITLENPPEHCIFILCTTEKEALPETIVSRAAVYNFGKIPDDIIKEHVLQVAEDNKIRIDSDAAGLLARYANGAMRNALMLLEHISMQKIESEEITDKDIVSILGLSSMENRADFLDSCMAGDIGEVINILRACERKGFSLRTFIQDVLQMNTDVIYYKSGAKVVGTKYYLDRIRDLASAPEYEIIRASKVLSSIAATPTAFLSVEKIVVDLLSVLNQPVETLTYTKKCAELKAESKNPVQKPVEKEDEGKKVSKTEPMKESEAEKPAEKEAEANEQTTGGFVEADKSVDVPFETVDEQDHTAKEEPEKKTFNGFALFGGGLYNSPFLMNGAAKKPVTDTKEHGNNAKEAVAGSGRREALFIDEKEEEAERIAEQNIRVPEEVEVKGSEEKTVEPVNKQVKQEESVFKDSVPVNVQGRITWDEAAERGLVPKKSELSLPVPESAEELDEIYAKKEQSIAEEKDEVIEDMSEVIRTPASIREEYKQANEELKKLLGKAGFKMLYNKARVVEKNGHIYLYYDSMALVMTAKGLLHGVKGISAELDKR